MFRECSPPWVREGDGDSWNGGDNCGRHPPRSLPTITQTNISHLLPPFAVLPGSTIFGRPGTSVVPATYDASKASANGKRALPSPRK